MKKSITKQIIVQVLLLHRQTSTIQSLGLRVDLVFIHNKICYENTLYALRASWIKNYCPRQEKNMLLGVTKMLLIIGSSNLTRVTSNKTLTEKAVLRKYYKRRNAVIRVK